MDTMFFAPSPLTQACSRGCGAGARRIVQMTSMGGQ